MNWKLNHVDAIGSRSYLRVTIRGIVTDKRTESKRVRNDYLCLGDKQEVVVPAVVEAVLSLQDLDFVQEVFCFLAEVVLAKVHLALPQGNCLELNLEHRSIHPRRIHLRLDHRIRKSRFRFETPVQLATKTRTRSFCEHC